MFVSMFEDELYWTDAYVSGVLSAHKTTGKAMTTIAEGPVSLGVVVVHPVLQEQCECYNHVLSLSFVIFVYIMY